MDWACSVHVGACCDRIALFGTATTSNMQRARPIKLNPPLPQPSFMSSSVETEIGSVTNSSLTPSES